MKGFHCYILLLSLIFLPDIQVHGQSKDYSRGFIITLEGDTLHGMVKDRKEGSFPELYSRIHFKANNQRSRQKYGPDDILGYSCAGQQFESLAILEETTFLMSRYYVDDRGDPVFLKIAARNEHLCYYHWEYEDSESNYIDYIPLFYKNGGMEIVRVTQGLLGLKRKRLSEYFADCPSLVEALERKWLTEIMEVYNFYTERCTDK